MLAVSTLALLASFVLLVAAGHLILDLRAAIRAHEADLKATRSKLASETASKVEALIALRGVRQRACSVCRTEDAYLRDRVAFRPAA